MTNQYKQRKRKLNVNTPVDVTKKTGIQQSPTMQKQTATALTLYAKRMRRNCNADCLHNESQAQKIATLQPAQQELQACKLCQLQLLYTACYNRIQHQYTQST
jgi:hypothetical protein